MTRRCDRRSVLPGFRRLACIGSISTIGFRARHTTNVRPRRIWTNSRFNADLAAEMLIRFAFIFEKFKVPRREEYSRWNCTEEEHGQATDSYCG